MVSAECRRTASESCTPITHVMRLYQATPRAYMVGKCSVSHPNSTTIPYRPNGHLHPTLRPNIHSDRHGDKCRRQRENEDSNELACRSGYTVYEFEIRNVSSHSQQNACQITSVRPVAVHYHLYRHRSGMFMVQCVSPARTLLPPSSSAVWLPGCGWTSCTAMHWLASDWI